MPRFTVQTSQRIAEFIEFTVEAADEDEARQLVDESDNPGEEFDGEVTDRDYDSLHVEQVHEDLDEDEIMGDHVCDDDCRSNGCPVYLDLC